MQDRTNHYNSDAILLDTAVDALLSLAHHGSDLSEQQVVTKYTISTDLSTCNSNSSTSPSTNAIAKTNLKKRKNSFMDHVNSHITSTSTSTLHHPGSKVSFPMEIFHVLNQKDMEHIVSWTPDGKSFVIHNMQIFQSYILPRYFHGIKFDSFQRKLYRWGFTKNLNYKLIKRGEHDDIYDPSSSSSSSRKTNSVIWSNALFQRNKPYLCHEMTCTSSSPTTTTTAITTAHSVHHEGLTTKKRRRNHHYIHGNKHGIVTATTSTSSSNNNHGDGSPIIGTTDTTTWQQPQ